MKNLRKKTITRFYDKEGKIEREEVVEKFYDDNSTVDPNRLPRDYLLPDFPKNEYLYSFERPPIQIYIEYSTLPFTIKKNYGVGAYFFK